MNNKASLLKAFAALALSTLVSACQSMMREFEEMSSEQRYAVIGPSVVNNTTPVEPAFTCLADYIRENQMPQVSITVGNVKDFTGKYAESEGGNAITQGGALMVISALGKLGNTIALRERFDTVIADREFAYMDDKRLGDGKIRVITSNGQQQRINFLPKVGGSVQSSQVYIVGGITELNYNLSTGGISAEIAGIGPRIRQYTISVAADLRLVNTSNLNVVKSVSLQKQVVGYEVKAGVFKFFGDNLFNIEGGVKSQEPLQLAVRTVLEMATLELVSKIYSFDYKTCFDPDTMKAVEPEPSIEAEISPEIEAPVEPVSLLAPVEPVSREPSNNEESSEERIDNGAG
ncbi:MAG: CsgG/HfaB family protein [Pseudomonadota bacterium]